MIREATGCEDASAALLEYSDRIIGRLRAALVTMGLEPAHVTRIAVDDDEHFALSRASQPERPAAELLHAYIDKVIR